MQQPVQQQSFASFASTATPASPLAMSLMRDADQLPFQPGRSVNTQQQYLKDANAAYEIATRRPADQPVSAEENFICGECGRKLKDMAGLRCVILSFMSRNLTLTMPKET